MSTRFRQTQLDNGMTVIAELSDASHTAAVGCFVNVGSRDEDSAVMGVSHFLEHMCFKGTARRTADQVNQAFDRIGAEYNAMTSQEATVYFAHTLPEHFGDAVDLIADIMRPALRDDDFEMEKNVILEEIGMYADRPFWVAYEEVMERYFGDHPLGHRILGTQQTVGDLTAQQMHAYFEQRYSPDNMVFSLAGRLDFDRVVDQLNALCGQWQRTDVQRNYSDQTITASQHTEIDERLSSHYAVAVSPGPGKQDELRYEAAVLSQLLGDSDGSRLYWNLIDPGIADEAELSYQGFDQTGTFMAYASCPPDKADRVESILFETLDGATGDLADDEVERARNKIAMDLMLLQERPSGRMLALGGNWLATGEYRPFEDELARIEAVNADSLHAMIDAYPFSERAIVRLTPRS